MSESSLEKHFSVFGLYEMHFQDQIQVHLNTKIVSHSCINKYFLQYTHDHNFHLFHLTVTVTQLAQEDAFFNDVYIYFSNHSYI